MERNGVKYINPTQEAQAEWKRKINELSDKSLFPTVKSTYVAFPQQRRHLVLSTKADWATGTWVEASRIRRSNRQITPVAFTITAWIFGLCCQTLMASMSSTEHRLLLRRDAEERWAVSEIEGAVGGHQERWSLARESVIIECSCMPFSFIIIVARLIAPP